MFLQKILNSYSTIEFFFLDFSWCHYVTFFLSCLLGFTFSNTFWQISKTRLLYICLNLSLVYLLMSDRMGLEFSGSMLSSQTLKGIALWLVHLVLLLMNLMPTRLISLQAIKFFPSGNFCNLIPYKVSVLNFHNEILWCECIYLDGFAVVNILLFSGAEFRFIMAI